MINTDQFYIVKRALETYGEDAQIDKAIEELTELTLALVRFKQNKNIKTENAVIDEIADVEIMNEQLKSIFKIFKVQDKINFKIERLDNRLNIFNDTNEEESL